VHWSVPSSHSLTSSQVRPSPSNPAGHRQTKEPMVL
jgi:hypothetical protein